MAEEREPNLENRLFRLEERQRHDRDTLAEYKERFERMEKAANDLKMDVQWVKWNAQEVQDQIKDVLPLAHRVASVDPAMVRIVIGALLSAVLGMSVGNFAFGSE